MKCQCTCGQEISQSTTILCTLVGMSIYMYSLVTACVNHKCTIVLICVIEWSGLLLQAIEIDVGTLLYCRDTDFWQFLNFIAQQSVF